MQPHATPRFSASRRRVLALVALTAMALSAARASVAETSNPYARAVTALADLLASRFVDPSTGQRYAQALRAGLDAGKYDDIGDAGSVARQLTRDLQAVAPDGHLRVDLAPRRGGAAAGSGSAGVAPGQASAFAPIDLPSVAEARWIDDGVAYLRFNQFAGDAASLERIRAFVRDHADARALIIDTRTLVRGGGLAEMDALFPHLFDRETVLVEMAVAKDGPRGGPASGGNTLREVDGAPELRVHQHVAIPAASGPRLAKAKVFYLTSKRTRSAGEHFALALQRTHRGTLIGERTAGANHFGAIEPIGAGLVAFIPVGRTYDPDTGKDWEGTGIVPDIEVPADQALDKALQLARG